MNRAILISLVALGIAGCGSSTTTTDTPTAAETSAAETSAGPIDGPCDVLTADDLNQVLGTEFVDGQANDDPAREISTCTYTVTEDIGGVEAPVAIVDVGLSQTPGEQAYVTNIDLAPAYFGNDAQSIEVPGASKAYLVMNEATDSPVLGMLVADQFALIQIGVEGATADQAQRLAQTAASRLE